MGTNVMIARLGQVLGWTGNTIALLLLAPGIFGLFRAQADHFGVIFLFIIPGILAFILGRALRYILVG